MPSESLVLNVILTHQKPAVVERIVAWWRSNVRVDPENLLVAHGGSSVDFERVTHTEKVFVDHEQLHTTDHQREAQSYSGVFRLVAEWLNNDRARSRFTHVYFAEYDHLPLIGDLNERQLAALECEKADVLGLRVAQVEETSHPHFLYHADDPQFLDFWQNLGRRNSREARGVILTMFGTGSFWTRAAFEAVAAVAEPFPIYLELFLPTAAHHLGYRVRPYPDPAARAWIHHLGDFSDHIEEARAAGAWTLHPVKNFWR